MKKRTYLFILLLSFYTYSCSFKRESLIDYIGKSCDFENKDTSLIDLTGFVNEKIDSIFIFILRLVSMKQLKQQDSTITMMMLLLMKEEELLLQEMERYCMNKNWGIMNLIVQEGVLKNFQMEKKCLLRRGNLLIRRMLIWLRHCEAHDESSNGKEMFIAPRQSVYQEIGLLPEGIATSPKEII